VPPLPMAFAKPLKSLVTMSLYLAFQINIFEPLFKSEKRLSNNVYTRILLQLNTNILTEGQENCWRNFPCAYMFWFCKEEGQN
jgi:hypothetical protein